MAAIVCCCTDDEMPKVFDPDNVDLNFFGFADPELNRAVVESEKTYDYVSSGTGFYSGGGGGGGGKGGRGSGSGRKGYPRSDSEGAFSDASTGSGSGSGASVGNLRGLRGSFSPPSPKSPGMGMKGSVVDLAMLASRSRENRSVWRPRALVLSCSRASL